MGRKWWVRGLVIGGLAVVVGCTSNPFRLSRNRQPPMPAGAELGPPLTEGPAMPDGAFGVPPPMTYSPAALPPGATVPPSTTAPPATVPQGPMPKEKPGGTTTGGSSKS